MSTAAEIAVETREGCVIGVVSGEVDTTNAYWVGEELTRSVPNDAFALVVDLSDTRYIDSAGIEVVFELSRRLGRRGQELRLVLPDGSPLGRVMELTDVASVATIHPSRESAIAG